MKKLLLILMILAIALSASAQSKLKKNFDDLTDEIMQNLQNFYPVVSTEKGIHEYDYALTDYSARSVKNEIAKLKKFERRLYDYSGTGLSAEDKINLKLLKKDVDITLHDLSKIQWHKKNPYMYPDEAMKSIYLLLSPDPTIMNERIHNVIARLKIIPDLLRQGRENVSAAPPVYIRLTHEKVKAAVDFFTSARGALAGQFPELSSEITISSDRVLMALKEYDDFLFNLKAADPNAFAIGKDDFDYKLQNQYFFNFDSDSLLKIGESLFARADSAYMAYLLWLDSNDTNDSVFVLDCVEKQDMLGYYQWEVEQEKNYLKGHDILTLPDNIGACKVVETPEFLRDAFNSFAYQAPGTFSPDQTGIFFVRPIPDKLDEGQREAFYRYINRRGFKGLVVKEAYPGRHLEFQIAAQNPSQIRKWQENNCMVEGWPLYCEEMMYNKGLYDDERAYLRILDDIRLRAAGIILDVKLQTGQMGIDEAVKWLADNLEIDPMMADAEISRYTLMPTVPMSYLIGKTEIKRLLHDVKKKEGDNFSLKAFHDRLLSEGLIPTPLIREAWGMN